jgi:hypothetical protein
MTDVKFLAQKTRGFLTLRRHLRCSRVEIKHIHHNFAQPRISRVRRNVSGGKKPTWLCLQQDALAGTNQRPSSLRAIAAWGHRWQPLFIRISRDDHPARHSAAPSSPCSPTFDGRLARPLIARLGEKTARLDAHTWFNRFCRSHPHRRLAHSFPSRKQACLKRPSCRVRPTSRKPVPPPSTLPPAASPPKPLVTTAVAPSAPVKPKTEAKDKEPVAQDPAPEIQAGKPHVDVFYSQQDIKTLLVKADQLSGNGKYDDAIAYYKRVLRQDPQNAEANRGIRRAMQNRAQ